MIGWLRKKYYKLWKNDFQKQKLDKLHDSLKHSIPIILVHQPGRAGSMSMVNTLRTMETGMDVYHTHWLNPELLSRRTKRLENAKEIDIPYNVRVSMAITQTLSREKMAVYPWRIVSIIREPVARNISAFFLSLHRFVSDANDEYANGQLDCNDLLDTFLREFPHHEPLQWFDNEIRDVFGIDVYDYKFPLDKRYFILTNNSLKLLVLRVEDLNEVYGDVLTEMFGKTPHALVNTHISSKDEEYSNIYKDFLRLAKLPKDYLDSMYESRYAQHFYTQDEIATFYRNWGKSA